MKAAASPPETMVDRLDFRYPGGKALAGLAEWICAQLPDHLFYAEPFAGKGAIFRRKVPALRSWLIDRDSHIVDWWNSILGIHHRRRGSQVIHGDGIRFVELAVEWPVPEMLIYCDPPYLPSTRVKQRIYRHEMTESDHVRLLSALVKLNCPAVVSGYESDLYADYLADWTLTKRAVITRGGTMRDECLWKNPHAAQTSSFFAMDYSDYGTDFRDRQRVQRKQQRWLKNFKRLPPRERQAILLALLHSEGRNIANAVPQRDCIRNSSSRGRRDRTCDSTEIA